MLRCSVMSDSLQLHGLYPSRLLCPGDGILQARILEWVALLSSRGLNPNILCCSRFFTTERHQGSSPTGASSSSLNKWGNWGRKVRLYAGGWGRELLALMLWGPSLSAPSLPPLAVLHTGATAENPAVPRVHQCPRARSRLLNQTRSKFLPSH